MPNARTVAVTISDAQWEEVLWRRSEPEDDVEESSAKLGEGDDVYVYADEEEKAGSSRKGDWVGVERDRRSAFLIIGALKSEGII